MYAFSPLVGRYSDQRGRLAAINVGAGLLVASTLMARPENALKVTVNPSILVPLFVVITFIWF